MISAGQTHSVLVVDDDDGVRTLIRRVLVRAGYAVTEASDGAVAKERLAEARYDAVVLDLMMPGVNGFEVLAYMREIGSRRCVIVVSAAAEKTIALVDEALVVNTLRKPFDLDALLAAVQDCVRD